VASRIHHCYHDGLVNGDFHGGGSYRHGDGGRGEKLGFLFGKEVMTWQTLIGQFSGRRIMTRVII